MSTNGRNFAPWRANASEQNNSPKPSTMALVADGHTFVLEGFQPKKKKDLQTEITSRGGKIAFMINKEVGECYYEFTIFLIPD
jgi:hypothetical protein